MSIKEERKQDAEYGHIRELKENGYICDRTYGKDYVFISYSSLNWKKVLYEIVYETCTKYGMRVYFDTKFDTGSDSWISQFIDNMRNKHCRAMLAFFSPEYSSSYATLMELMASQTIDAGNMLVLPVSIGSSNVTSVDNTGLGTYRFADNSTNELWGREIQLFNELFQELAEFGFPDKAKAKVLYKSRIDGTNINDAYWEELDYECLSHNEAYWNSLGINIEDEEEKKNHWKGLSQEKNKRNEMLLSKKKNAMLMQMLREKIDKNTIDGVNKDIPQAIHDKLMAAGLGSVFEAAGTKTLPEAKTETVAKSETAIKTQTDVKTELKAEMGERLTSDGYTYTIFGREYFAKRREQGKLMYDVFIALTEKYPDKADALTACTSVAHAEDVMNPNDTKQAYPTYFRSCKKFTVGARDYYVGTSYGFENKLVQIREMLKLCGEREDTFQISERRNDFENGQQGMPDGSGGDDAVKATEAKESDRFEYRLWGESHTADKLAIMMHDVFDLISEKYPEKIGVMAQDGRITAVAAKEAVDQGMLPPAKMNYFSAKKEHKVQDSLYYVSTRYNREEGIGQLKKMLAMCEGNADAFVIESMPQKTKKRAETLPVGI